MDQSSRPLRCMHVWFACLSCSAYRKNRRWDGAAQAFGDNTLRRLTIRLDGSYDGDQRQTWGGKPGQWKR